MAGDWIPIRTNLDDQPEVLELARLSKKNISEVVGILTRFWCWASEHSDDGKIVFGRNGFVTRVDVDVAFLDHMCAVGWLRIGDDERYALEIPKWDEWLSESAKKRAKNRKRQQLYRDRRKEKDVRPKTKTRNAMDATNVTPVTAYTEHKMRQDVTSPSAAAALSRTRDHPSQNAAAPQKTVSPPPEEPASSEELVFEWLLRHFGRLRMESLMETHHYTAADVAAWQEFETRRGTRLMVYLAQRHRNPAAADAACKAEPVKDEAYWLRLVQSDAMATAGGNGNGTGELD